MFLTLASDKGGNDEDDRKLFVRDILYTTSEDAVRQCFEQYGELEECKLKIGPDGKSKGYAFVTYKEVSSANSALQKPEKEIDVSVFVFCCYKFLI